MTRVRECGAVERTEPKVRFLLFVCTGNTCRSPMAEQVFRDRMPSGAGWSAESAGLGAAPGSRASCEAVEVLREVGLDASEHRARPVTSALVDRADAIVVMTHGHKSELERRFPAATGRVRLLTSYAPHGEAQDIFDPIGMPVSGYRKCLEEIAHAVSDLVVCLVQGDSP